MIFSQMRYKLVERTESTLSNADKDLIDIAHGTLVSKKRTRFSLYSSFSLPFLTSLSVSLIASKILMNIDRVHRPPKRNIFRAKSTL